MIRELKDMEMTRETGEERYLAPAAKSICESSLHIAWTTRLEKSCGKLKKFIITTCTHTLGMHMVNYI